MNKGNSRLEVFIVLTTLGSKEKAFSLAEKILENRLAGCINCKEVNSKYWWNKEIQSSEEFELLIKTNSANLDLLIETIISTSDYDLPEVIYWPVKASYKYTDWINKNCRINNSN